MLKLLLVIAVVIVVAAAENTTVRSESLPFCGYSNKTSTCPGDVSQVEIWRPFWIENRTVDDTGRDCQNHPSFQIKCAANGRPVINISSNLYYVLARYSGDGGGSLRGSLTVTDVVLDEQECPQPRRNISIESEPLLSMPLDTIMMTFEPYLSMPHDTIVMSFFYNCTKYPQNVQQHIPCLDNYYNNGTGRSFAFLEGEDSFHDGSFDWYGNCGEAVVVPVKGANYRYVDSRYLNYIQILKGGFYLRYQDPVNCGNCELSGGKCGVNETNHLGPATSSFHCDCGHFTVENDICRHLDYYSGKSNRSKIIIGVSVGVGVVVLLILLIIYRKKIYSLYTSTASSCTKIRRNCYLLYNSTASNCRKIIKGPTNAEAFIWNNYEGLYLQNYTYSEIKKMTNFFEDSLGQGGYGSVFKGKLRDGRLVAVKVLNESKGKGEDFINEVGTIGRTNHVNVVGLLGFCIDGTKQALVYEFMPNGSLEKFIHTAKDSSATSSFLGWEKLYQIALGIARGLEYLHRGCNARILHFDIKPHNILLDQDFCPKISDFGLAKLCPTRESLVSMVGARGTVGYIAPEVYCGNFGGVSHKSDVYSYGMMVLEMIGGRKNIDPMVENISEIYFPQWIYKRLKAETKVEGSENSKVGICGEVFKEEVTQRMIIVALWCIQAHPGDRPSMTHVLEMLEGKTEDLQLPPNPFPDASSKPSPSLS